MRTMRILVLAMHFVWWYSAGGAAATWFGIRHNSFRLHDEWRIRGGSSKANDEHGPSVEALTDKETQDATSLLSLERKEVAKDSLDLPKRRRTSDIILDLIDPSLVASSGDREVSDHLRSLMMNRREEVVMELHDMKEDSLHAVKRLLHVLAPKIPAIKLSPDVSLSVRSLPGDIDPGLAASLVATIAHLWEIQNLSARQGSSVPGTNNATVLVARELVHDRRFEQLIETIICGVDMQKRMKEALVLHVQHESNDLIQMIRDTEVSDGLSIRDACRAAWGVAMLGMYEMKMVGETKVKDLLIALGLRVRELLLARVRLLCMDDFFVQNNSTVPVQDRIVEVAREIAEDTATAMWAFGCVQAVTGLKCGSLVHVCASILCNDPFQLRQSVQEAVAVLDEPVLGGSDVIDKLDRAEKIENVESTPTDRHEDVFLDFLSPTEVTDVLWALGVHSMKESTPEEYVSLLSDIAVDRVVEWLSHDLKFGETPVRTAAETDEACTDSFSGTENRDNQVDVSDASSWSSGSEMSHPENGKSTYQNKTGEIEYVEVVDAAAILASESREKEGPAISENGGVGDGEPLGDDGVKTVDAAALVQAERTLERDRQSLSGTDSDPLGSYLSMKESIDWLFSGHDLCSLSWAVTELDDSLKSRTTQMVADLLVLMGRDHLSTCSSADYANLLWAMAKECGEHSSPSTPNFHLLGRWIAENVIQSSGLADAVIDSDSWSLLRDLQPPELSRLLWSLASLSLTTEDDHLSKLVGVLSLAGLEMASRSFHVFSTEDLARIGWAFVEFSDYRAVLETHPSSLRSLGRMLSLVDMSLTGWEAGHSYMLPNKDGEQKEHSKEENRFTSFFGRARSHIPKLERKIQEMTADDQDDYPMPSLLTGKARLPFLKDFPIDPATLCKLCGSLNRPGALFSNVCDAHVMTKVALRLMTSRHGRLLGECHVNDLVALCVAAVSVPSSSNRELVGLFARRFVKVLNENPQHLAVATPVILAKMLGALGDLGVKYQPGEDSPFAYRRLQLTSKLPVRDGFDVSGLSDESLTSLSRGLASLNAVSYEEEFVARVLQELDRRIPDLKADTARLADILESVSHVHLSTSDDYQNHTQFNATKSEEEDNIADGSSPIKRIHQYTTNILNRIADASVENVHGLTASELRNILQCFVSLPFRVDHLISATENEILRREASARNGALASAKLDRAIQNISPEVVAQLVDVQRTDPSKAIKKLLRVFGKEQNHRDADDENTLDGNSRTHGSLGDLAEVILSTIRARERKAEFLAQQSDHVEHGRIQELIDHYRRIDFESGARMSRFDQEDQRFMAKRMMSRLLP